MRRLSVVLGLLGHPAPRRRRPGPGRPAVRRLGTGHRPGRRAQRGGQDGIEQAIDELQKNEGISESVVLVDSFDGAERQAVGAQTAEKSGLGANDVMLAVAVGGERHYGVHPGSAIDADKLNTVVVDDVEPKLSSGDWAGAAVALAEGLGGGLGRRRSGAATLAVVVALILVAGGAYLFFRSRGRRRREREATAAIERRQPVDPYEGTPTEQLNYRASAALLDLDERWHARQVNLDYRPLVLRRGGRAGVRPQALATVPRRAGTGVPHPPGARRRDPRGRADDAPHARRAAEARPARPASGSRRRPPALDELRERERTAPQAIEDLRRRIGELQQRLPPGAGAARGPAAPVRARRRCAGGRQRRPGRRPRWRRPSRPWSRPSGRQQSGSAGRSVGRLRGAEHAVGQSATLLDAIERLAGDLAAAEQRLAAARAETEADLAEARSLHPGRRSQRAARPRSPGPSPRSPRPTPRCGRRTAGLPDPLAALRRIGGGGRRAGAGPAGRPRRADPGAQGRRGPGPGAAHRPLVGRGGRRLHQHPPRRRRPRGAHPAGRGAAAPRRRAGPGAQRPGGGLARGAATPTSWRSTRSRWRRATSSSGRSRPATAATAAATAEAMAAAGAAAIADGAAG